MKLAWQFIRKNGFTLSEALKTAWANVKLGVAMAKGIVKFYFQKVDGTRREAYGTTNLNRIPSEYHPRAKARISPPCKCILIQRKTLGGHSRKQI